LPQLGLGDVDVTAAAERLHAPATKVAAATQLSAYALLDKSNKPFTA
jgi:hypothetical protein